MDKINILNKQGMLTDEDRKEPYVRVEHHSTFYSNVDLSSGIRIVPHGITKQLSVDQYSQDVASFIAFWTTFVMKDLNGFSGMSHVKFYLDDFELVDTNQKVKSLTDEEIINYLYSKHDMYGHVRVQNHDGDEFTIPVFLHNDSPGRIIIGGDKGELYDWEDLYPIKIID